MGGAYEFPNLFQEVFLPTLSSIIIFTLADLRHLARTTDDLVKGEKVLDLPLSGRDVHDIVTENDAILKEKFKANHYETVQHIRQHFLDGTIGGALHHLGDDDALHECVHAVVTFPKHKQVFLTFRGSITRKDWMTDFKFVSGSLKNPVYSLYCDDEDEDQPEYFGVHVGFRNYICGKPNTSLFQNLPLSLSLLESIPKYHSVHMDTDHSSNDKETGDKRKIDVILDQVEEVMKQYPDHALYVTGHSLGGALATLASLEAAVRFGSEEFPVTCVTIASPRVGDSRFRGAVQLMERKKKLRMLTVANQYDLVPLAPNRVLRFDFCRPNEFCVPGMQMTLSEHGFKTKYQKERDDTMWEEFQKTMRRLKVMMTGGMGEQHNYRTYLDRLVALEEDLTRLYLNDLYKQHGVYS